MSEKINWIRCLLKGMLLTCTTLAGVGANAALLLNSGAVVSLRIENGVGLVMLGGNFGGTCGSRAWVDVGTPHGKAAYATAMLALSTGRAAFVRVDDSSQRMFGECGLYDIVI